jgi:hypothetical protein
MTKTKSRSSLLGGFFLELLSFQKDSSSPMRGFRALAKRMTMYKPQQ